MAAVIFSGRHIRAHRVELLAHTTLLYRPIMSSRLEYDGEECVLVYAVLKWEFLDVLVNFCAKFASLVSWSPGVSLGIDGSIANAKQKKKHCVRDDWEVPQCPCFPEIGRRQEETCG